MTHRSVSIAMEWNKPVLPPVQPETVDKRDAKYSELLTISGVQLIFNSKVALLRRYVLE